MEPLVTVTGSPRSQYEIALRWPTAGTVGPITYSVGLDTGIVFTFGVGVVVAGDGQVIETGITADRRRYPGEGNRRERRKARSLAERA